MIYIPREGVIISGPVRVRYEKHPWIEQFELDGIKAAPAVRTGYGTRDARDFIRSLNTIYSAAYEEFYDFADSEAATFDAVGYYAHITESFISEFGKPDTEKHLRMFCGLVENLWREGDKEMCYITIKTILPLLKNDTLIWKFFADSITDEFCSWLEDNTQLM